MQVKRELHDSFRLIGSVTEIYCWMVALHDITTQMFDSVKP